MDWAMRSARSGSVAASALATWLAPLPSEDSSVMDWAMCSGAVRVGGRQRRRDLAERYGLRGLG